MKRNILIANILLTIGVYICNYCYLSGYGFVFKCLGSAFFALTGIVNLIYAIVLRVKSDDLRFPVAMAGGLFLALLGDIFVNSHFVLGAGLFALGHVFYFVGYCFLSNFKIRDGIISAVLFICVLLYILFGKNNTFAIPAYKYVCIVYAFIICVMTGKAVSNIIERRNIFITVLFFGSILFFFSDFMLFLDWFANAGRTISLLCMVAYYPAECLLARAVYFYANEKSKCLN